MENNTNITTKKYNVLKQPGATLGVIGLVAMGVGLLYVALPYMIAFCTNLFKVCILIAGLAGFGLIISPFIKNIGLIYFMLCRIVTGWFVEIDPIAVLKKSIIKMKDKLKEIESCITNIQKNNSASAKRLKNYEDKMAENIEKLKTVRNILSTKTDIDEITKMEYEGNLEVISNEISLLDSQIKSETERLTKSEQILKYLKKVKIKANSEVKKAESKVIHTEEEYKNAKQYSSARKAFMSIFDHEWLNKSMEEELALESISNTINAGIADMERMLADSDGALIDYNISTAANLSKVDKIIADFEGDKFNLTYDAQEVPFEEVERPKDKVLVKSKYF